MLLRSAQQLTPLRRGKLHLCIKITPSYITKYLEMHPSGTANRHRAEQVIPGSIVSWLSLHSLMGQVLQGPYGGHLVVA